MHGFWQRFEKAHRTPHSGEKSFQYIRTVIGIIKQGYSRERWQKCMVHGDDNGDDKDWKNYPIWQANKVKMKIPKNPESFS